MEKQPKKESLGSKLKETVVEWCKSSTSHGLPNIFRNESYILKIIWLLCFCASTGYCFYSLYISIIQYFEYQVTSQISQVFESPTEFPTVTICNQNMFVTPTALNFTKDILSKNGIVDPLNLTFASGTRYEVPLESSSNFYFIKSLVSVNAFVQNDTTKQSLGWQAKDFMPLCIGNGGTCNYTEFKWFFDPYYGNCFQYNR